MIESLEPGWLWMIGGVLLLVAEIIAPGFFLVFVGAAAIATGAFTLLFGFGVEAQLALFVAYTILAVLVGRKVYANQDGASADPLINNRSGRMIGKVVVAVTAVDEHGGRVRVGDGEWSARGGPAEPGQRLRITGVDGNCLQVQAESLLTSSAAKESSEDPAQ
ncbi:MAG: NfeD family protein [Sphingomicrobium sp.]